MIAKYASQLAAFAKLLSNDDKVFLTENRLIVEAERGVCC